MAQNLVRPVSAAQYGDKTTLNKLSVGMKDIAGTDAKTMQRNAGRPPGPAGGGSGPGASPPAPAPQAIPQEHVDLIDDATRKQAAAEFFTTIASQPTAGSWARLVAAVAVRQAEEA